MTITPKQLKDGRRLLGWSRFDLSMRSGVSLIIIARAELETVFDGQPLLHKLKTALEAAGVEFIAENCRGAGVCGTCRAKLVEGEVAMLRNFSLEPWEVDAGFVLTCQAQPRSDRVVLDYDQM